MTLLDPERIRQWDRLRSTAEAAAQVERRMVRPGHDARIRNPDQADRDDGLQSLYPDLVRAALSRHSPHSVGANRLGC